MQNLKNGLQSRSRDFEQVPEGMETFILKGGLYAVFLYHGAASAAEGTFRDILGIWLPGSAYCLDDRPHFEILGEKYKNESPDSEEELWIPIKPREVSYSLAPWLTLRSSIKAVDFYKKAFNAVEVYRLEGEGEDLVARLSVGNSEFWVSNGSSENKNIESSGEGNIRMILTVTDPDALFDQALKAGASQVYRGCRGTWMEIRTSGGSFWNSLGDRAAFTNTHLNLSFLYNNVIIVYLWFNNSGNYLFALFQGIIGFKFCRYLHSLIIRFIE